ncbi:MAG TPA: DUF4019 domain-containing protein [Syntrophorhabdales bacterium]|nr:DUF4019 domain-containing protein [Syntrophorhabdales bacterium]
MIWRVLAVLAACMIVWCGSAMAASQGAESAAVSATDRWLKVVDSGKYAESWNEAADYFKAAVRQEQWEQSLQAVRKSLGNMVSRKLKSKTYQTSLPGAPDGEYVVIQYQTSFENKKSAVETVTTMKEKDGTWRVAGYFIK